MLMGTASAVLAQTNAGSSTKAADRSPHAAFPIAGEWPAFRRDGTLQAHSPLKGNMTKPKIVWKQFVGGLESRIILETGSGDMQLTLPGDEDISSPADSIALADFIPTPRRPEELNTLNTFTATLADVLPEPGKEKLEFESTFNKPLTNGQYARCFGRCFTQQGNRWIQAWQTKPIKDLFIPLPLVGDFDGDGTQEIAILPFYQLKLVDARTGTVKDSCRFTENRNYGFHGVYDFDHDGKSEFLIQADFSKHVDVLGFRDGKLSLLWQRKIEPDIADAQKIMLVASDPVMDIDRDNQLEVITTIYNDTGDKSWHVSFVDALTGQPKADFPDEVLAAHLDLDGDGVEELLTTCTDGIGKLAKVRVRSMKGNELAMVWEKENVSWQTWNPQLPAHVKSIATLSQETVLSHKNNKVALVVLRQSTEGSSRVTLFLERWNGSAFETATSVTGDNLVGLGFDATGRLLVDVRHNTGTSLALKISRGRVARHVTRRIGREPASAIVAWPDAAREPTIVVQGVEEEQVLFHPPQDGKTAKVKTMAGRGQGSWWPLTFGPVVADLAGDGRRQLLIADAASSGFARLSAVDLDGTVLWRHEFPLIAGTPPPQNTGGVIFWQAGHFTDHRHQDVLVTTQRSKMHTEETFLLSGTDGHVIWHRDRQVGNRAVGGNSFAVADYDNDGFDDLASLWPGVFYLMKGTTGQDILAMQAQWNEVYKNQVYFGQAIAGNFLNEGTPAIFFSGRLMTGLIRLDGTLAWFDAVDKSPGYLPSFGDFNGDGRADLLAAGFEDGVRCYDMASGKVNWRMPNPAPGFGEFGQKMESPVKGSASADLDGDGKDEALVVIDRTLYCLGGPRKGREGEIRWRVELPARVGPPTVVTLTRNGSPCVLVTGSDGYVYCVR